MSERARLLIVCAALLAPVGGSAAQASDVDQLRARFEAIEARRAAAADHVDSLRRAADRVANDSFTVGSRTIRFATAQLTEPMRAAIATEAELAWGVISGRFGAEASALHDGATWRMESYGRRRRQRFVRLDYPVPSGKTHYVQLDIPIDSGPVTRVTQDLAALTAVRLHPMLAAYATEPTFDFAGDQRATAASDLALAGSSVGRRCLRGSLTDCRAVLGWRSPVPYLERFYAREDWQGVVARRRRPRNVPAGEWTRMQEACVEENDIAACERALRVAPLPLPFRPGVRSTFAAHALWMGGAPGIERLRAARDRFDNDPIGLLAHVAGVEEDALMESWRADIVSALDDSKEPVAPALLSTVAWAGVLLLGASLRRPR